MPTDLHDVDRRLQRALDAAGASVAVAESLTGGQLSARLAAISGSGDWFRGGLVAYAGEVKRELLGVPPGPVVAEQAVVAMAEGVAKLLHAEATLAVSGVAGPDPQDGQPPGTVWFARHHHGTTDTRLEHLQGEPEEIVAGTVVIATTWLLEAYEDGARA